MSELTKTGIFAALALVVSVAAIASRPAPAVITVSEMQGKELFPDFTDPLAARTLEIHRWDSGEGEVDSLNVTQKGGRWVIASHRDYPADAATRLRDVATLFLGSKVIGVVPPSEADIKQFGLLAPDEKQSAASGADATGTQVILRDGKGGELVNLVIGKAALEEGRSDDAPQSNLRFVRRGNEDAIFVVDVDLAKLSTEFGDWIEKDLLKLNAGDLARVTLKDYSAILTTQGAALEPRSEIQLAWRQSDFKWELETLKERVGNALKPRTLLPSEEINTTKLDEFKSSLGELQIVDVEPKPEGLGADLRVGQDFLNKEESVLSLARRGFYPHETVNGYEILSSEGEVLLDTNDGVQYVLRFGQPAGLETGEGGKLRRFLFVSARVNHDLLPKPELEPLPAEPQSPARNAEGDAPPADGAGVQAEEAVRRKAQRERIEKENKRRQDDYEQKVKDAERKANELNFRFADWFYIISDDVYQKIHLGRTDILREKDTAREEGFDVDSFRNLEEGLDRPPAKK